MSIINIIIFLLCKKAITDNIAIFEIDGYNYNRPFLSIDFPNEDVIHSLELNTYLNYSAFDLEHLNSSQIINRNCSLLLEEQITSILYYTDIKIQNKVLVEHLSLYSTPDIHLARDNGIGLGYHFNNESFSIVHKLYKSMHLPHLQFSFHNANDDMKGHLYIGGIPDNNHLLYPYKGIVKVNEDLPTWGFNMTSIIINGREYKVELPCIVNTAIRLAIISDDLYQLIIDDVLKEEVKNKLCREERDASQRYLRCNKNIIKGSFDFVFNNEVKIRMSINDFMMSKGKSSETYELYSNNKDPHPIHYFNGVIFGMNFLNRFNYTVFDYENKQMEFYSDSYVIEKNVQNSFTVIKTLVTITIVLTILNFILLTYTKFIIII